MKPGYVEERYANWLTLGCLAFDGFWHLCRDGFLVPQSRTLIFTKKGQQNIQQNIEKHRADTSHVLLLEKGVGTHTHRDDLPPGAEVLRPGAHCLSVCFPREEHLPGWGRRVLIIFHRVGAEL